MWLIDIEVLLAVEQLDVVAHAAMLNGANWLFNEVCLLMMQAMMISLLGVISDHCSGLN